MEHLARLARGGEKLVNFVAMILVLLLMLYAGYSLYDNWLISQAGFGSELMKYKPDAEKTYSFEELIARNPDVVAWLTIDDTHIDYPVVQGKDDAEYLNKDALGEFSLSGSLFLSCLNAPDFSDPYSLIYGHHMDNGGMFGDITNFLKESYFEGHRKGTLRNTDHTWTIELFSVVKTDAAASEVYSIYTWKESNAGLKSWLKEESLYYRDAGLSENDAIIGLSTCYDTETNGRVIVFGKLELQEVKDSE